MKKILKWVMIILFCIIIFINPLFPQISDPPTPPDESQNDDSNELGGGAPVGNGMVYLLAFALIYGFRRLKKNKFTQG